jgi:enoyl-CoA hydratase/carnithine racemase
MYNNIIVENFDKIQIIKLNRPKSLNALSKDLLKELSDCLIEADNNKRVRCVILTGNNKSFSSGADMKEAPESDMPFWAEKKRLLSWKNIENFKKPIIAAVNGWALGGGLELALLCDFIIAGDKAKFGTPEIKVGAFAGDGGTQRVPRLIGKSRALYMQLTGEFINAEKAKVWGLVVDVFEEAILLTKTIDIAKIISKWSPKAAKMIKEEVKMNDLFPLNESLSLERKLLLWQSKDHDEGVKSFIEKRDPNYEDD